MAKSIRSKAKRKLRAVKREKIAAKERLKLIALKEQEEGRKMVEGEGQVQQEDINAGTTSGDVSIPGENDNEVMEVSQVTSDNQTKNGEKKSLKNSRGKKVKRLGKKKKMKYKW